LVILLLAAFLGVGGLLAVVAAIALFGTVFAAVYHAEVVAHRVGEPFGTLVLALAVTVIETALIVSVVIAAPGEKAGLARDTVFAAVMIVCNVSSAPVCSRAVPVIASKASKSKERAPPCQC
jgi:Ca2+:H+ antiporter